MITVHHLDHSRSQRVLWLLEELGLAYAVRSYQRNAKTWLAPAELAAVHPLGKAPVLTDDDFPGDGGAALVVAETGAIFEHLLDRVPDSPLRPLAGSAERRRYTYWLHFAEGSAMPPLVLKLIFNRIQTAPMPFFARPIAKAIAAKVLDSYIDPTLRGQLAYIEGELAARPWLCGDAFSAVDILMSFPLEAARDRAGLTPQSHPKVFAWLGAIHARPAHARALARGQG